MSEVTTTPEAAPEAAAPETPAEATPEVQETTPEEAAPEEPKPKHSAKHYALLRKEAKLAKRESALAERESNIQAKAKELEELDGLSEIDLLHRIAKKKGVSTVDLMRKAVAMAANGGQETEADRLARLEKEIQTRKEKEAQEAQEREAQGSQAKVQAWKESVAELAAANEADFPLTTAYSPAEIGQAAYEVVSRYHAKKGKIPPMREVLAYIEKQEQIKLDRLSARRKPKAEKTASETAPAGPAKTASKTLTNNQAAQRASTPAAMTERERIAYAAQAIPD